MVDQVTRDLGEARVLLRDWMGDCECNDAHVHRASVLLQEPCPLKSCELCDERQQEPGMSWREKSYLTQSFAE